MSKDCIPHQVRVLAPISQDLTYLHNRTLAPGVRVRVPLANRQVIGVVVNREDSDPPTDSLKWIDEVLDDQSLIPQLHLKFLRWAGQYYGVGLEVMLAVALPKWAREGRAPITETLAWRWNPEFEKPRGKVRQALFECSQSPIATEALKDHWSIARELIKTGQLVPAELPRQPAQSPMALNDEQRVVVDSVNQAVRPWLLEGVTGSGKTEVYLHLAQAQLARNKQVLVLVPEIGLTPQLVGRFEARFPGQVVHLHSALTDRKRWQGFCEIASAQKAILIGTRSALLTPLPELGLIVVDEEHDTSYKQGESPRYNARDLAVVLGQHRNAPVVLGSATPSLESIANRDAGRFGALTLRKRARATSPTAHHLIDIRGLDLHEGLSDKALDAIRQTLERGEQALVFLNRRGFAPVLTCHQCGYHPECPSCDARPTVHREPRRLWCHHCDHQSPWPADCPSCGHRMAVLGQGTQRLETTLSLAMDPFPVTRIDRDSAGAGGAGKLLALAQDGLPRVLIGTQMLAKGHDLPNLTCVVVVDSDAQLFSGDFRAIERLGQTLIQVMGRAGRADKPGSVWVQTHQPDHPVWPRLLTGDYAALAQDELALRRRAGLPPHGHMALWRARSPNAGEALQHLREVAGALRDGLPEGIRILGPTPAPMERRAGQYHAQLLLMGPRAHIRTLLNRPIPTPSRRVWRGLDIDPQDLF